MNINPTYPNFPMASVTPSTDSLRRDNSLREVITQPTEVQKPTAEKGPASEFDKAKPPGQQNEYSFLAESRAQAKRENSTIGENASDEQSENKENQPQNAVKKEENNDVSNTSEVESAEIQQEISQLKQRDLEVRTHEAAHASVGGQHAGAPSFTYQQGPDGKKYAVGGEVNVSLSRVSGNPQATIRKMQQVHAAALAPANPSTQDTRVAATAMRIMAEAQRELVSTNLGQSKSATKVAINIAPDKETLTKSGTTSKTSEPESVNLEVNKNKLTANNDGAVEQAVFAKENKPLDIKKAQLQSEENENQVEKAVFASSDESSRTNAIIRRSLRIENLYMNVNHIHKAQVEFTA